MVWAVLSGVGSLAVLAITWRYFHLFINDPIKFNQINSPPPANSRWKQLGYMGGAFLGIGYMVFAGIYFVIERMPERFFARGVAGPEAGYIFAVLVAVWIAFRTVLTLAKFGERLAESQSVLTPKVPSNE